MTGAEGSVAPADVDTERILSGLLRHPRVAHQRWAITGVAMARLGATLPRLVPFGGDPYTGVLAVLDWDHRLPSRAARLRLYAYTAEASLALGRQALTRRGREIARKDIYPEFDVPDFGGLAADESYEAEVAADGTVGRPRLVSPWRRTIPSDRARLAVRAARRSEPFRALRRALPRRPASLGDLEAMSWTPPCESGHPTWTIDVWYLTQMGPTEGRGRSFLVDPGRREVVATRDFAVQPR